MKPERFGIGARLPRIEDPALIQGQGQYTADLIPSNAVHGYVLRSEMAHAKFSVSGLDEAKNAPGVHAIILHEDIKDWGHLPYIGNLKNTDGTLNTVPPHYILAKERVTYVGEPIAFIVADKAVQARDAAEMIIVDYDELPSVITIEEAIADGAPQIHEGLPGNISNDSLFGDADATDALFETAAETVSLTFVNNRLVTNYLEPRAAVGIYDGKSDDYSLFVGSQGVHFQRDTVADIMGIEKDRLRVVTKDVGGGFGTKNWIFHEYPLVLLASKLTGKPAAWVGDRTEHFLADWHGRDHVTTIELALDEKQKFLALRIDLLANMGSTLSAMGPLIPYLGVSVSSGVYNFKAASMRIRGVFTNTTPIDAYRGAGRPEAAYAIERLVDKAALELGTTPDKLRRKNFVTPGRMPYKNPFGGVYDSGEFAGHMDRAMEVVDWKGFKARKRAALKRNKLLGIGMCTYIEACGGGGPEDANVYLNDDGSILVTIGTQSNGQGHQTAYAQIASEHLGLPMDKIKVVQGDTSLIKKGAGTGGSRSIPVGGASLFFAAENLADEIKKRASDELEAAVSDIELTDGQASVMGTDKGISFADIAKKARAEGIVLTTHFAWKPPAATFPNGTHICEIEIDRDTAETNILNYVVVDDFGVSLTPVMLEGQVHGGVVQGLGQAIFERVVYDDSGQLLTASFMDYALPRADDVPSFHFETRNVPCKTNPMGVKGAGEAGAIGSCAAAINAIVNALHEETGITHIDMPATRQAIFDVLQASK